MAAGTAGREAISTPPNGASAASLSSTTRLRGCINNYEPFDAEFCKTHQTRLADNDRFICGRQFGESNHWMEALDDGGAYIVNSLRARQPFDFAGRTGNVVWDVDAKTEGGHSFWPEVWLTDEPVPGPAHRWPRHPHLPSQRHHALIRCRLVRTATHSATSRCSPTTRVRLRRCRVGAAVLHHRGRHANHFQLKSARTTSTCGRPTPAGSTSANRRPDAAALPLTRGYLSFQHAQYNAPSSARRRRPPTTGTPSASTVRLPPDRGYEVPDALQHLSDGTVNLGYQTPDEAFSLPGVNLSRRRQGVPDLQRVLVRFATAITANINGVDRAAQDSNPDRATAGTQWRYIVQPVALSDLHAGTNTLTIKNTGCGDQCPTVANIDLELVLN